MVIASATRDGWARHARTTHAQNTALDAECAYQGHVCVTKDGLERHAMSRLVQTSAADTAHALEASVIARLAGRATTARATCVETLCALDTAHAIKESVHAIDSGKETDAIQTCALLRASRVQAEAFAVMECVRARVLGEDRFVRLPTVDPRAATTTARVTLCLLCASASLAMRALTATTVLQQRTQARHLDLKTAFSRRTTHKGNASPFSVLSFSLYLFALLIFPHKHSLFDLRYVPYNSPTKQQN